MAHQHSRHCRCKLCHPDLHAKPGQVVTPPLVTTTPINIQSERTPHSIGCQCEDCMYIQKLPIPEGKELYPYQVLPIVPTSPPPKVEVEVVYPMNTPLNKITTVPQHWPPGFLDLLRSIAYSDTNLIREKEHTYKGSWKKRGGQGAFFTFARPIDRYEEIAKQGDYDLLGILQKEYDSGTYGQDGTLSATIKDIRCYLLLLEAEATSRNQPYPAPHE